MLNRHRFKWSKDSRNSNVKILRLRSNTLTRIFCWAIQTLTRNLMLYYFDAYTKGDGSKERARGSSREGGQGSSGQRSGIEGDLKINIYVWIMSKLLTIYKPTKVPNYASPMRRFPLIVWCPILGWGSFKVKLCIDLFVSFSLLI